MKEFEEGKRVLSPTIFRKSKGPIMLSANAASLTSTNSVASAVDIASSKAIFKKPDSTGIAREISLQDYDINQCFDMKDVHCKY